MKRYIYRATDTPKEEGEKTSGDAQMSPAQGPFAFHPALPSLDSVALDVHGRLTQKEVEEGE